MKQAGYRDESEDDEPSDEEVLGLDIPDSDDEDSDEDGYYEEEAGGNDVNPTSNGNNDDDDEIIFGKKKDADDEEEEGWGSKSEYYLRNGDTVQTEEDAKLEEEEAKRLQAARLAGMKETDFIFDEDEWAAPEETDATKSISKVITEELPAAPLPEDPEARLKILRLRHPEFEPLSRDFLGLQETHKALSRSAAAEEAVGEAGVATTKFRALSTYLGVLGLYFAVLTSDEAIATNGKSVREHGVMEGILRARKVWEAVKDLAEEKIGKSPPHSDNSEGSEVEEQDILRSETEPESESSVSSPPPTDVKRRKSSTTEPRRSLLPSRVVSLSKSKKSALPTTSNSDFTDEIPAASTSNPLVNSRRRALSFHATQLTAKSNKRRSAVVGGDLDIPHKERLKERQERLQREVERKRALAGADLGDDGSDEEDEKDGKRGRDKDSDEEYYDMVAHTSKKRKAEREERYADWKAEEMSAIEAANADDPDGKRKISYQIEKNKGLTPHRKKEVRNPRVKKRMRYEKAKKRLGSKKAIYKPLQGAYGGEMTGIKGGLVKSRKLG